MKTRATSFLLALLAIVSLVLPALAAASDVPPEEPPAVWESPEIVEEEADSAILLDGEPVETVEYEIVGGVCYATVSSFVTMLDAEAMVEEENGVVSVNAAAVVEVVETGLEAGAPAQEPAADEFVPVEEGDFGEPLSPVEDAWGPVMEPDVNVPLPELEEPSQEEFLPVGTANVETDDLNLIAAAGASYLVANGRYLYADGGLIQLNGSVAAPVRVLARVFNLTVNYDPQAEQVLLDRQAGADPFLSDAAYDVDTLYWLSRIIQAESGNQLLEGKIAVGNVVMNRLADPRFPDTLYDVLFQKNQFSPARSGSIYREPSWESVVAAMLVMDGAQVVPGALFFNSAGARSYASRTKTYVTTIGDHAFYK